MTDAERYQADARLKTEHREAVADLSRCRQQTRYHTVALNAAVAALADAAAGKVPQLSPYPTPDVLTYLFGEITALTIFVARLEQDIKDRSI